MEGTNGRIRWLWEVGVNRDRANPVPVLSATLLRPVCLLWVSEQKEQVRFRSWMRAWSRSAASLTWTFPPDCVKIDDMGKGRGFPIPRPRDNLCCRDRTHAWGTTLCPGAFAQKGSCRTVGRAGSRACLSCQPHGSPACLPPKSLPQAQHHQLLPDVPRRAEEGGRRPVAGGEK